jgi:UDP-N-acetylmuramoyl-L-alanyl-D-glutamate--2,6-diaminopimelate ligase
MRLGSLLAPNEARQMIGSPEVEVTGITSDSRRAGKGSLFACISGAHVDGHDFAARAVSRGASAIMAEHPLETEQAVAQVIVEDVRSALALVASRFHGNPSHQLKVIGVTGTNGKTTSVHIIRSIIETCGGKVGVLGTLGHWVGGSVEQDHFTTPEAPELHKYMRAMLDAGLEYCVMEVSSHSIAQRRADYVDFDVVAFTNLSRDHLDFHGDFEEYAGTKMELFAADGAGGGHHFGPGRKAAINVGDPTGEKIAAGTPLDCLTYCLEAASGSRTGSGEPAPDLTGKIAEIGWRGFTLDVSRDGVKRTVHAGLKGRMNAENTLTAYSVAVLLGIEDDDIARGIEAMEGMPGRMEVVSGPERVAIVDYAHTPDALRRLLADVREICSGRLICVFGCGGDRDRGKRPQMGRIAGEMADRIIVTSDNPRTEDPLKIIEDIVKGLPQGTAHEIIPAREEAITRAVALSGPGDVILVAGKGHEDYQIIGSTRRSFDDRDAVRKAFGAIADARS